MGSGRASRRAHQRDDLSARDAVADGDEILRVVAVARRQTVAMIDLDEVAIALAAARPRHDTVRDRLDGGTERPREIDALMVCEVTREGIAATPEVRGDPRRI